MLQRGTALAAMLALSLVLVACGGSPEQAAAVDTLPPAEPAQTPSATPTVEAVPTQTASATPEAEISPAESASEDTATSEEFDLGEHLREKTMQLWEVYNTYDVDGLKVFYEENYWNEQEKELRSNIEPFKNFGATITAEETSPPTEIELGKWEIKHTARFTGGSVNIVFIYENFGGQWLLTYAEAQ